jgi:uncharacterized protein (TIGR00295 family)
MTISLTPEDCIRILEEAGCDEDVVKHCRAVAEVALKIADRIDGVDTELVHAGALLHDLGRARTHGIEHVSEGVKLARELELPEEIVAIIQGHVGGGLSEEDAAALGLPEGDYMPVTFEQKIVAHADNLIDYFKQVPVRNTLEKLRGEGHYNAVERVTALHKELSELAGIDIDKLIEA